jgi:hypothetical protein
MARRQAAATSWARFVNQTEHPAGIAPATPPWEGGMLLLHHGRTCRSGTARQPDSGSGGSRTHVVPLKRRVPRRRRPHFRSAPPMGFEPTTFPVTGERPLRAGPRGRISCRGGSRTHDDRLIRAVPCRLATPQALLAELSKTAVPRAGVEPDLGGLKDRRPHRKSNGAYRTHKRKPAGGRFTPGRRVFRNWRVGSSAGIQTKTAHPGFDREAQTLRDDRGGRMAKVIARVPECHGGIVCKLFSPGSPAGCDGPPAVYAR